MAVVVDASVGVWAVVPAVAALDVTARLEAWQRSGTRILSPSLWRYEVTSAIRGLVHGDVISAEQGRRALQALFALPVAVIETGDDMCLAAFEWAARLHQRRAYDALYLAAAERLGAELWTGDRRLANAARLAGAGWVHWIGEAGGGEP